MGYYVVWQMFFKQKALKGQLLLLFKGKVSEDIMHSSIYNVSTLNQIRLYYIYIWNTICW